MLMLVALRRSAEGVAAAAAAAALRGRGTPGMPLSSSRSLAYGGTAVRHRRAYLVRQQGVTAAPQESRVYSVQCMQHQRQGAFPAALAPVA